MSHEFDKELEPSTAHHEGSLSSDTGPRHTSGAYATKPRRRGILGHCGRFWWVYLLLALGLALLVVLLIIYVAFPRIAQSDVNDSTLEVISLSALNPTADSVEIVQEAILRSQSKFHPTIDAFDATLALKGEDSYGVVTLPQVVSGEAVAAKIVQTLKVTNLDAFTKYNVALFGSKEITQNLKGSTWLHEGSLPAINVNYDKLVTMKGFDNLAGFAIKDFKVLSTPEDDGTNMVGTISIPNPSVITFALGNVTFDNYVKGKHLGNSTIANLVLKPGENIVDMRSNIDQLTVLALLQGDYKDGILPVEIAAKQAVYNGVHLTYYEAPLKSHNLTTQLDAGKALKAIGLDISTLGGSTGTPP